VHSFSSRLIRWQRTHGRHDLPWQGADTYRVWLSEIMLQQTQVATVIPYYQRFVAAFPDVAALAAATEDEVLAHWSGLGYYARGRNLHKAARIIIEKFGGEFPCEFDRILELPGIGRSTAAAICAQAYHNPRAILDGNVKRLLARWCGIEGWAGEKKVEAQLWRQAEALLPQRDVAIYTQALMDMGATVCTRSKPKCGECPLQKDCVAFQSNRIAELPASRPKKAVPEKHTTFLLLMHGSDILLEKRPGSGIWGGLWCPPQLDDGQGVVTDYLQRNGVKVDERIDLPEFTHSFTHFKLHILPVLLHVVRKPLRAQQPGGVWLEVEEALRAAIPTPVRKMLKQVDRGLREPVSIPPGTTSKAKPRDEAV
jgi:A/G-specific adenine glycosylase